MSLQALYWRLPVALQHAAVSARGYRLRRLRHTRHSRETLARLLESERWPAARLEAHQAEALARLVGHARRHSPYYAERYRALGLDERSIRGLGDLARLPVVAKEELRRENDRFVSTHLPRRAMWPAATSGTTGTPIAAYHTHEAMQERVAFLARLAAWYGLGERPRRASFTGKLVVDPDSTRPPFHRTNRALRQQLYSSHHLRGELLGRYVDELAAFGPELIDGIASPIYAVADHLLRSGRRGEVAPALVMPTSETLWPHVRERIAAAFAAPVANQYGSQEGAPIAYECPRGGFHVCSESGIFEVLRPDGAPCPPGELGRLVVTSFLSDGMPLIRYDIGDTAAWRAGTCPCGRELPLLAGIEGRIDDMFFTSERGVVPRLDSAFKSLPATIVASQVAQVDLDRFELRIVPDPESFRAEHADTLVANLHDYLGRSVRIEVALVSELPRTAGGKLRAMVNECDRPEVRDPIARGWNAAQGAAAGAGDA